MISALARGGPAAAAGTLILARRDIAMLMDQAAWLEAVETGFRAASAGKAHAPAPMTLYGAGGAFHAKGASLALDRLYVALKLNGNFPDNPAAHGLPTIQGAILLCDGETGALLAIMDSIEVTLRRTAAATALAARFLARRESRTLLICGCGAQARAQLAALREMLPLRRALAWDRDQSLAAAFAREIAGEGFAAEPVRDLGAAARQSDVIVTCTTSHDAFLEASFVRAGTFVAAVGADSPDKSEVHAELMAKALVVADVLDQCAAMGDLRLAFDSGLMAAEDVHAELGDLVAGRKAGRTADAQITLFDSTGTALQDVASAALIYERARRASGFTAIALGATA
jgi:ornithine cyclodeaminase/alanine dehydrogenase-like protein (mu-crystallin family)